jgi:polysaccharide pyruvyl transferase WcaK-like protein
VFNLYREVIGGLAADPDADLLYMVHTDREIDAARRLRREFPTLRICRYPAAKLLYVYGQLDLVVSMMLHSAIFAFAAGVPAVSIAYDEKNRAFMDDTGHPERCFDVASASASRILPACHAALGATPSPADGEIRASYADATDNFAEAIAALCRARGER